MRFIQSAILLAGLVMTAPALATQLTDEAAVRATVNALLDSWREANNAKGERSSTRISG